jgi:hypothetical protein
MLSPTHPGSYTQTGRGGSFDSNFFFLIFFLRYFLRTYDINTRFISSSTAEQVYDIMSSVFGRFFHRRKKNKHNYRINCCILLHLYCTSLLKVLRIVRRVAKTKKHMCHKYYNVIIQNTHSHIPQIDYDFPSKLFSILRIVSTRTRACTHIFRSIGWIGDIKSKIIIMHVCIMSTGYMYSPVW